MTGSVTRTISEERGANRNLPDLHQLTSWLSSFYFFTGHQNGCSLIEVRVPAVPCQIMWQTLGGNLKRKWISNNFSSEALFASAQLFQSNSNLSLSLFPKYSSNLLGINLKRPLIDAMTAVTCFPPRMRLIAKKNSQVYVQMALENKWICPIQLGNSLCAQNFLFVKMFRNKSNSTRTSKWVTLLWPAKRILSLGRSS